MDSLCLSNPCKFAGLADPLSRPRWPGWTYTEVVKEIHLAVRRLHAATVRIQVGTDPPNPFIVPGASVYEEMRLLGGTGFSAEETWIAATRNGGMRSAQPC